MTAALAVEPITVATAATIVSSLATASAMPSRPNWTIAPMIDTSR